MSENLRFVLYAAGIFICYFFYGILQEKITKGDYVDEGGAEQPFTFSLSLVFLQCIINCLFATVVKTVSGRNDEADTTTYKMYALCSMSYIGAMFASNKSLQWVSYPTQAVEMLLPPNVVTTSIANWASYVPRLAGTILQALLTMSYKLAVSSCVLGKSAKPIPVMIMGMLFASKKYPRVKYLCVLLITIGVALFVYKDSKATEKTVDAENTYGIGMGEILLVISLLCDGGTGVVQSRMKQEHKTKSYDMMINMNLWSVLWIAIALSMGEMFQFIAFAQLNPHVFISILTFGAASALGQHFIFLMVSEFGPLPCSITTTTRKFFTILVSIIVFGHSLLSRQWLGTVCVFIGLGLDMLYGKELKPGIRRL